MTTEEKARAYDEALERAKKFAIDDAYASQGIVAKLIFPQLRESEDERIRKELIKGFQFCKKHKIGGKNSNWAETNLDYDEVLAWLEKQKEPENVSATTMIPSCWTKVPEQCLKCNEYEIGYKAGYTHGCTAGYNKAMKEVEQKEQMEIPLMNGDSDAYFDEWNLQQQNPTKRQCFEEGIGYAQRLQKEQKPAVCLKAERDGWYMCIKDYYRGGKKQCSIGDLVQAKGGMYMMGEEDISEWFRKAYYEEVRNAFEPNADTNTPDKPAEWSEEDEKMRYYVTEAVQFRYSDRVLAKYLDLKIINGQKQLKQKLFDWLRDLRPQPKKELSIEKAIQWLDDTFYFLDNSSGRGRDCEITTRDFDSLEEMYDSFRKAVTIDSQPHWKPSEEQMEALREAVHLLADSHTSMSVRLSIIYDRLREIERIF